ncbi:hypothetical protein [Aliarcobacter butzleri]|uniref:Uncharacterized protein n=1 Tax=Aliarcobacter butzleri TaxID=28197 RepID=A0AAW7PMN9_9BACT|nr:hypothetical protein [Aliarcobacter butzleri]MDN5062719.1 hypothetical protein [Aliarcobacter butzleri]MDN5065590.1 hypothetical protein [Aliarcobacter butzleri]
MINLANNIKNAINKFDLNIENKVVLTEAATGNYVVTPIIAALAGAKKVYSYTKNSKYGSVEDVKKQTFELAKLCNIEHVVEVITNLEDINLKEIDILTNTGFLRPINKKIIDKLKKDCVIPLMWETWEFRDSDLDLEACYKNGIKVYGTNEDDERLRTKEYIGYMVLNFLLDFKHTPITSNVLLLGCDYFNIYIEEVLKQNNYKYNVINEYNYKIDISDYNVIVLAEHHKDDLLIGTNGFIDIEQILPSTNIIHICGNVDFSNAKFKYIPETPANFGYMSYTADYMGSQVVIDLHTAGFKVAEGMIKANQLSFKKMEYKKFMEDNYPALSFENERYW